ncbi:MULTISPECIES: hypothetical protein [Moorena]|uniref:Uncharacterized protein n=1 Tax=Moorena producens 3L TaxID=489825 RepID=F4XP89_9CYAN|nr:MULTISPECIES: hypothetical protein [Moorena]EGJ33624.1 hypothetical protein LYNGBM3L_28430 [Moorena producens 3L]
MDPRAKRQEGKENLSFIVQEKKTLKVYISNTNAILDKKIELIS